MEKVTYPEEFKRKAATVFEAAVKSKIRTEIERLENEYEEKLKEDVQSATEEMTDKVDTYLNYVTCLLYTSDAADE